MHSRVSGTGLLRLTVPDADEAWTLLVSALRSGISGDHAPRHFIDDWMALELTKTLSTTDAPDESPSVTTEKALKLECNITINTNFLMSGILDVSHGLLQS